jgi:hypothetical protein
VEENMFDPNDGFLYLLVAVIIIFVVAESIFFLIKAWRHAKRIGIDTAVLKNTAISSAIFSLIPALAILIGVIALSKSLGFPLPWLRLSVIGALTYETTAAAAATNALGASLSTLITDPKIYSAVAWVMTIGIIPGMVLVPLFGKKIENGLIKIKSKDSKWGELFLTSLFLGMISAFLGVVFADIHEGITGWIPVFVMIISAMIMILCGICIKKFKIKWLEDYALPISMLGAMALAIPLTNLIYGLV